MHPTIFLLSPANLKGVRARQLTARRATFPVALAYRSPEGVPLADAFSFMSALYFRGKIAYARRFTRSPEAVDGGIFVIAPGYGLVPPEWRLTPETMRRLRRIEVDPRRRSYRQPLERHSRALADLLDPSCRVVLLGSIATRKYLDVLAPVFGDRLHFPGRFAGIGDMSRGALMLQAVREDRELEYVSSCDP